MFKADVLACLYKQYRADHWLNDLFAAAGVSMDVIAEQIDRLPDQMFADQMSWQLAIEERMADIKPPKDASLEKRRAALLAKWCTGGKIGLKELRSIVKAYGNADIDYKDNKITILMREVNVSVMETRKAVYKAVYEARPAHIPFDFLYLIEWVIWLISQIRTIPKIKVRFSPLQVQNALFFDDSWCLNGTYKLNGIREEKEQGYPLASTIKTWFGRIPALPLLLSASNYIRNKAQVAISSKVFFYYHSLPKTVEQATVTVTSHIRTAANIDVLVEKDWWTFDGNLCFDGSRLLDAEKYKLEV